MKEPTNRRPEQTHQKRYHRGQKSNTSKTVPPGAKIKRIKTVPPGRGAAVRQNKRDRERERETEREREIEREGERERERDKDAAIVKRIKSNAVLIILITTFFMADEYVCKIPPD